MENNFGISHSNPLVRRAFILLEDGDFLKADEMLEQVLNAEPENAMAYVGKLMIDFGIRNQSDLKEKASVLESNPNYLRAVKYSDAELLSVLNGYCENSEKTTVSDTKADISHTRESNPRNKLDPKKQNKLNGQTEQQGYVNVTPKKKNHKKIIVCALLIVAILIGLVWTYFFVNKKEDIIPISAGSGHSVVLKSDGTVVAVGHNLYGQCDVSDWEDIELVSAGNFHTVGLKSDGTLVAVGNNQYGQCDVSKLSE